MADLGTDSNGDPLYKGTQPVPIGTIVGVSLAGPDPAGYTIVKYAWDGGSNYAGYITGAASDPPPPSAKATPPIKTNRAYTFIVDATVRQYTVTLNVTYENTTTHVQTPKKATLTFTSVKGANGSLAVKQKGSQTADASGVAKVNPPIQISATSSVAGSTKYNFMFMQILNSETSSYVDQNGQPWYIANTAAFPQFNGPLLDSPGGKLSYWYVFDTLPDGTRITRDDGWTLPDQHGNKTMPAEGRRRPLHGGPPESEAPSSRYRSEHDHYR